jgi:hypothetical protein
MACETDLLLADATCLQCLVPEGLEEGAVLALLCDLMNNTQFQLQVARGLIPGMALGRAMGHNPDVDTASVPEDLWEGGGLYPFQTTAQSLEIVSSSAADAAAGTGLRTARVSGLDANYVEVVSDVTLNGVGVVAVPGTFLRVNDLSGLTAGSGNTNAGVVTLRVAGGDSVQAVMDVADGRAQQMIYTVPAGKTAFITHGEFSVLRSGAAESAELQLHLRAAGGIELVRALFAVSSTGSSSYQRTLEYPLRVGEKTDVRVIATFVSANNTPLTSTLFFVLIDN